MGEHETGLFLFPIPDSSRGRVSLSRFLSGTETRAAHSGEDFADRTGNNRRHHVGVAKLHDRAALAVGGEGEQECRHNNGDGYR